MAESVDALVSNTSGATHPGSSPGPGTELETLVFRVSNFFFISSQLSGFFDYFEKAKALCEAGSTGKTRVF